MPARGGVTVLVVSHELTLRQTLGLVFLGAGFGVRSVELGDLATLLQRINFRVVLLDHTLTREERHSAVPLIRRLSPNTRVVALHASARDSGADLHMDSREGIAGVVEAVKDLLQR
jgi:DNA-binding response OmpR family regulator